MFFSRTCESESVHAHMYISRRTSSTNSFYSELRVRIYILEVTKHEQITHWRVEGKLNKEHYRHE